MFLWPAKAGVKVIANRIMSVEADSSADEGATFTLHWEFSRGGPEPSVPLVSSPLLAKSPEQ